jgi:hypothetical protein
LYTESRSLLALAAKIDYDVITLSVGSQAINQAFFVVVGLFFVLCASGLEWCYESSAMRQGNENVVVYEFFYDMG